MIDFLKKYELDLTSKMALYFHIPFCASKCYYCDFFSQSNVSTTKQNIVLKKIIDDATKTISYLNLKEVETIYIGGGTPSYVDAENIVPIIKLGKSLHAKEITVEVNPESVSKILIEKYITAGVTRISMGIQSFNQAELDSVGRNVSLSKIEEALAILKPYNYMVSLDLIAGLPNQTKSSLAYNLKKVLDFSPAHISLYELTIEEDTPLFTMENLHPSDELSNQLWLEGKEILNKHGYIDYEISNFAKDNHYSKHNLIYWQLHNFLGFGPSATGNIALQNGTSLRIKGLQDLNLWLENKPSYEEEIIPKDDFEIEHFVMGLRSSFGLDKELFIKRFSSARLDYYKQKIKADNWQESEKGLALSEQSRLFLNTILVDLLDFKD